MDGVGWIIGGQIGWLDRFGGLDAWMVLVGKLNGYIVGRLAGWMVLVGWISGWLVGWYWSAVLLDK